MVYIMYSIFKLESRYETFTHSLPNFRYFVVKLCTRIIPYLAGSDYRLIVRIFADDNEAKVAVHDRFCTPSEIFRSGALKEPLRRRRKY